MGFRWDKEGHSSWKDKVSFELIEIRQRILAIESRLDALSGGKGVGTGERGYRARSGGRNDDFTDVSQFRFYKRDALSRLENLEADEKKAINNTKGLVNATPVLVNFPEYA